MREATMPDLFEALHLCVTHTGSRSQLEVGGELDVWSVGPLSDRLALLVDAGGGDVDVDMALVTFCDAATLRVLLTVHGQLGARGQRLSIVNGSPAVVRLLQLTGLEPMLRGPTTVKPHRCAALVDDRVLAHHGAPREDGR
jgi:anti-sigma B factor antagonist